MNLNLKNLTKILCKTIVVLFIVCSDVNQSRAQNKDYIDIQTYTIGSFNGQPKKITITYDYNDRLKISYSKDTIYLHSTYGTNGKAEIINKKFLKITYDYMAGSDLHNERIIVICIKDDKLCVPLSVTSLFSSEITQVYDRVADSLKLFNEKSLYQIKVNATIDDRLIVNIHDENKSKHDPKTNYNRNYHTVLLFDQKQNIFYNGHENLAAYYTIFHPDTYSEERKYLWGYFPLISLGKSDYYYIKGQWYEKGDNNYLTAYSTTNVINVDN